MRSKHAGMSGLTAFCLLTAACPPAPAQQKTAGATLTVIVHGIHDRRGLLRVSLYQKADGFLTEASKATRKRDILLASLGPQTPLDPITVTFADLSPGAYAVSSLHDSNGNDKLDTNFLGAPREDWAVSNDARPRFRAPRFDEAKFTLGAGGTKVIAFRVRH